MMKNINTRYAFTDGMLPGGSRRVDPFRTDEEENDITRIRPADSPDEDDPEKTEIDPSIPAPPRPEENSARGNGLFFCVIFLIMFASSVSFGSPIMTENNSNRQKTSEINSSINELTKAEFEILSARLDEIRSLDIRSLSSDDKRQLRKEVKDIKHKITESEVGVYISATLLIIILLLIILL